MDPDKNDESMNLFNTVPADWKRQIEITFNYLPLPVLKIPSTFELQNLFPIK
jgi:hypothetical protein